MEADSGGHGVGGHEGGRAMLTRGHLMLPRGSGHDGELRCGARGRHWADVGVVVLEAGAVCQLGPHTAQRGELVCNEETVRMMMSTFIRSILYQLNLNCSRLKM